MNRISEILAFLPDHRRGGPLREALPAELRRGGIPEAVRLPHYPGEPAGDRGARGDAPIRTSIPIPEPVDIVDIFRRSEFVPEIVEAAIRKGAKVIWMQEDVHHEAAAARAEEAGLAVVMDRCILKDHRRARRTLRSGTLNFIVDIAVNPRQNTLNSLVEGVAVGPQTIAESHRGGTPADGCPVGPRRSHGCRSRRRPPEGSRPRL